MPTTSPLLGVPMPVAGDTDQVPADVASLVAAAEPMWIGRFTNSADRTAKLTAAGLGSGVRGMLCWLDSPGRYETYDGTSWAPLIQHTLQTDSLAIVGANWDGVTPQRMMVGRQSVPVGGSALFNIGLSPAFSNGLLSAHITPFDNANLLGQTLPIAGGHTLSSLQGQAFQTDGTPIVAGSTVLVNYIAVGW